tara:strand:+ start:197 stop:1129 length:933 start_codon:yes stop_codon:yes gene_type:complete
MGENIGYGKTILFGEHFVVYGIPAIASALGNRTIARAEKTEKFAFIDNRPETPGYKEKKTEEIQRQLGSLLEQFGLEKEGNSVKITLEGNLICNSGVGASAALAVSIVRALNELLGKGMDDIAINKAAHKAEEAGSGPASGIDDTCSTFGGFLTFEKNLEGRANNIETLSIENPVEIVLATTGITQETKKVVADVRAKKETDEESFREIVEDYRQVYKKGLTAIKAGNWNEVGKQMDKNQELLRQIDVSCDEIEEIVKVAKAQGALGAKLTGTGRGGYVLLLTPGQELQEKIAKAVEKKGYTVFKTQIGV